MFVANISMSETGAGRGSRAGSPRGVVDATGSGGTLKNLEEHPDPVATAPGSDTP
jgi:hypothetical protein